MANEEQLSREWYYALTYKRCIRPLRQTLNVTRHPPPFHNDRSQIQPPHHQNHQLSQTSAAFQTNQSTQSTPTYCSFRHLPIAIPRFQHCLNPPAPVSSLPSQIPSFHTYTKQPSQSKNTK
ncbi:hypothetical protein VTI74DRAFT_11541 [Chaetomium olivicolor]